MSLQAFQQALADLVISPELRARVALDPAAGLAPFDLTGEERKRLAELAADPGPGMRTSTLIHRSFRLSMLSNTLPLTCRALGAAGVREVMQAYWREHLPRNYYYVEEAFRFGRFALAFWAESGFSHPLLPELLEMELAVHELAGGEPWPGEGAAVPLPPAIAGGASLAPLSRWRARLHPSLRAVRFRRDPGEVLRALEEGRLPSEDLPEGEFFLLLVTLPTGQVDQRAVAPEWGRTLCACDGRRSLAEQLAGGGAAEAEAARERLGTLAAAGYLTFEEVAAGARHPGGTGGTP